jgi:hypothetical protein
MWTTLPTMTTITNLRHRPQKAPEDHEVSPWQMDRKCPGGAGKRLDRRENGDKRHDGSYFSRLFRVNRRDVRRDFHESTFLPDSPPLAMFGNNGRR